MLSHGSAAVRVLLLAANPADTTALRLGQEARDIQEVLDRAEVPCELRHVTAVRPRDIPRKLRTFRPSFVHFSGHGQKHKGIILEGESGLTSFVPNEALASLFRLLKGVRCVFLNSCYSSTDAESITQYVPYVIAMKEAISDEAAREFSFGFYQAIGDGENIPAAFEYGKAAIRLANFSDEFDTPVLFRKGKGKRGNSVSATGVPSQYDHSALVGSPAPDLTICSGLSDNESAGGTRPESQPFDSVAEAEPNMSRVARSLSPTTCSYEALQAATWEVFEQFCIEVLGKYYGPLGFNVSRTKKQSGNDFGGDGARDGQATLMLGMEDRKGGEGCRSQPDLGIVITIWIEVKKRSKTNIDHHDVGGTLFRSSLEPVTKIIFVSNRDFTKRFREDLARYALNARVQFGLIDGNSLVDLAAKLFAGSRPAVPSDCGSGIQEYVFDAMISLATDPFIRHADFGSALIEGIIGEPVFIVLRVRLVGGARRFEQVLLSLKYEGKEFISVISHSGATQAFVDPGDQFHVTFITIPTSACSFSAKDFQLTITDKENNLQPVNCSYDSAVCAVPGAILPCWVPPSKEQAHNEVRTTLQGWLFGGGNIAVDVNAIAGVGKSHLVRAIRGVWLMHGALEVFLDGATEQSALDIALAIFRQLFPLAADEGSNESANLLAGWLAKSGLQEAYATQLARCLCRGSSDQDSPFTSGQLGHFAAVILARSSDTHAIVLTFEDLHKCLPSAITMLQGLRQTLSRAGRGHICTLFTSREDSVWDDESLRSEWRLSVEKLRAGAESKKVVLKVFQRTEGFALIAQAIPTIETHYAEAIVDQVGTSPFGIREALAFLIEQKVLEPSSRSGEWMLVAPDELGRIIELKNLREATHYRMLGLRERYPEWLSDFLDSAACLGRSFELNICLDNIHLPSRAAIDAALAECRRLEILRPAEQSSSHLQFDHDIIRSVVLQNMGPTRQRRLAHGLYGLLAPFKNNKQLAYLAYQAGLADECWVHARRQSDLARAAQRHADAVQAIGLALAVTDQSLATSTFSLASNRTRPSFDDAIAVAEPCTRSSLTRDERNRCTASLLLDYAEHAIAISSGGSALVDRIITECEILAQETGDRIVKATSSMLRGRQEMSRSNAEQSLQLHQAAEDLFGVAAGEGNANRGRTQNLVRLAVAYRQAGRLNESRSTLVKAVKARLGIDWELAAKVRSNMGATYFYTDWDEVRYHWRRSLKITELKGLMHHHVHALIDLAYLDLLEDIKEGASSRLEEALRISRDYGYENSELRCLLNLGCLALMDGQARQALGLFRDADILGIRHRINRRIWRVRANMATAYFMINRLDRSYVADRIALRSMPGLDGGKASLDDKRPQAGSRFILALVNIVLRAEESRLHAQLLSTIPDEVREQSNQLALAVREGRQASLPGFRGRHCKRVGHHQFFIITE